VRRLATVVLALFYLLQATWLLQGGVDLLFPRTKIVKPGSTDCCTSGCGCPEEAKARKRCCCYSGKDAAATTAPVEVPVSTLEEARCHGATETIFELISVPAHPGPALTTLVARADDDVETPVLCPSLALLDRSVDKVPI
jgi:hypothetical protein